jgi:NADPH:quinone reductase-like Zn-dependent oxidoreductase
MKAIHLTAYGNPAQNLKMVEVSEPNTPSAGEALVRMEYAPIAYSDLLLANGVYLLKPKLPSVIGGEGAGIVEAIGPGVTSVHKTPSGRTLGTSVCPQGPARCVLEVYVPRLITSPSS